ncbi:MAG: hypothetical protein ACFCUI_03960 [Bernardetiaceae bacterium]
MIQKIAFYGGIILCLAALFSLMTYIFDYAILSAYGKGFIWGKLLLLLIGILLIAIYRPRKT